MTQTSLPPEKPAAHDPKTPCAWCRSTPTSPFQLEKARYTTRQAGGKELRLMARAPITAPACGECRRRFELEAEARDEHKRQARESR